MDEPEENLNDGALIAKPRGPRISLAGPMVFGILAILCCAGSFVLGGYISLGTEGIKEKVTELTTQEANESLRPTYEWVDIEKTIYQLDRREDAKFVLAKFTLQIPIDKTEEVRSRLPELEFALQTYIRELSSRELQGAMGLYNLRNACLFRARRILGRDAVSDILIQELLVE